MSVFIHWSGTVPSSNSERIHPIAFRYRSTDESACSTSGYPYGVNERRYRGRERSLI